MSTAASLRGEIPRLTLEEDHLRVGVSFRYIGVFRGDSVGRPCRPTKYPEAVPMTDREDLGVV